MSLLVYSPFYSCMHVVFNKIVINNTPEYSKFMDIPHLEAPAFFMRRKNCVSSTTIDSGFFLCGKEIDLLDLFILSIEFFSFLEQKPISLIVSFPINSLDQAKCNQGYKKFTFNPDMLFCLILYEDFFTLLKLDFLRGTKSTEYFNIIRY